MMNINKEFRIVFSPYQIELFDQRKRFLIGGGQLAKYVGKKNAETAKKTAFSSETDKTTIKYRTRGKLEFYVK